MGHQLLRFDLLGRLAVRLVNYLFPSIYDPWSEGARFVIER
jgi:hypothetical protein